MERKDILPRGENLRAYRRTNDSGTFFVTKCIVPRISLLANDEIASIIIETFRFSVDGDRIKLSAFVIMPDHWHALFAVLPGWALPKFMKSIGTWMGKQTSAAMKERNVQWQKGYYDTRITSSKQFLYIRDYIELNPVRKGLAQDPESWKWSSMNPKFQDFLSCPWPWPFEKDSG